MEPVRLAIVGCGGMGRRHLAGLGELKRAGDRSIELVAVCDLNRQNAEDLADEAEALLGARPAVFTDAATMVARGRRARSGRLHHRHGSHHKARGRCCSISGCTRSARSRWR